MLVNKSEQVTFWDIDGTLILHVPHPVNDLDKVFLIKVIDPVTQTTIYVNPHSTMIRLMREEHARGGTIKVWSRGGWAWAEAVITALGLTNLVDEVMSKPYAYYDDVPIADWLTNRVYLTPGAPYKGF